MGKLPTEKLLRGGKLLLERMLKGRGAGEYRIVDKALRTAAVEASAVHLGAALKEDPSLVRMGYDRAAQLLFDTHRKIFHGQTIESATFLAEALAKADAAPSFAEIAKANKRLRRGSTWGRLVTDGILDGVLVATNSSLLR